MICQIQKPTLGRLLQDQVAHQTQKNPSQGTTEMKVTLYTKPNCPQCDLTKRDMDILGIEYETVDLTRHQDQIDRLIGMGHRSAPVIEAEGVTWSGYDQDKIKSLISY